MKKILLISLSSSPGMTNYSYLIANELVRRYDVYMMASPTLETSLYSERITFLYAQTYSPNITLSNLKPLELVRLARTINKLNPDVIHFLSAHPWNIPLSLALYRRKRVIVTVHDPSSHVGEDYAFLIRLYHRWFIGKVYRSVVLHGRHSYDEVVQWMKRESSTVSVIPLGSEVVENPPDIPADRSILFFGRILAYKGLDVLLAAAELLIKRGCPFHLTIAGGGSLEPYEAALSSVRDHVTIRNERIREEEVPELFQASRFIVLPYLEASQSGIIPICFSNRRPAVATNVGSLPEFVEHDVNGLLVDKQNPAELADAIEALLNDVDRNRRLAANALDYFHRHLSIESMVERLEHEVYFTQEG